MKSFLHPLLISILSLFVSFHSFSQTPSREVLVEDTLYHFELAYNFSQKLVDSTSISLTPIANQELFKQFLKKDLHTFFMNNYNKMLAGTLKSRYLQGSYNDFFDGLKNSPTLLSEFESWKLAQTSQPIYNRSHGTESGTCENLDFELGNYNFWNPSVGDVNCPAGHPQGCVQNVVAGTAGFGANREHRIVTGGFDPDIPALSRLNPRGGTSSLMLGDEDGGRTVAIIEKDVDITRKNPYFTYDFAVVFWDPSHPFEEQPWFKVEFFDSLGNVITNPNCANYSVVTGGAIPTPGFITVGSNNWKYKPWARITVDFTNYIGQTITVKFSVADCGYGAHDGRAYIDSYCISGERYEPTVKKNQNCNGIELIADTGYMSYQWFGGNPQTLIPGATNQNYYIPGPGQYKVEVISESGCTLVIDTLINDIYVILNQTITQVDPSCVGVNDGSLTINAYGGQAPYTYSIDGGTTIVGTNSFIGLGPGTYTCIVYDSGGCSDTLLYNLTNPPDILPNLVIKDAKCFNMCNGEVMAIPSGGTSPGGTYRVEFNNVFSPTKTRDNFCAGAHTVKVIDEQGCFTITPFIIAEPIAEVIDAIIVQGENCFNACDGSITIIDATAAEYSINAGATWQSSNVFNNLCAQAGPYEVAIKTANGCIARSTELMTQPNPLAVIPVRDTFICLNKFSNILPEAIGGVPPYTFSWSDGTNGPSFVESPPISSTYVVTVTDANGCTATDEFNINLHPQPDANFTFSPGPETDVFNTKVTFTNTTEYGADLDYEWFISNFATDSTRNMYYEFPANGGKNFTNCLKVENIQGCRDSICKELRIKYEVLLFVPNSFTPNDDNVNEVFLPIVEGLEKKDYKFFVFNRWGQLLFSTSSQTEGWDGTYNGKLVDEDAYIWRVVGRTQQTGEEFEQFGHVTVLRKL
jgi:gliding motility-associated-like protein